MGRRASPTHERFIPVNLGVEVECSGWLEGFGLGRVKALNAWGDILANALRHCLPRQWMVDGMDGF